MNIIRSLYKTTLAMLAITFLLAGCTDNTDEIIQEANDATDLVRFDIPPLKAGGQPSTRVIQKDTYATWEKGDVIYIYATFLVVEKAEPATRAGEALTYTSAFSALKCVDPDTNYWKYLTNDEFNKSISESNIYDINYTTPLRWPIGTEKGWFVLTYASSKADGTGTKVTSSQGNDIDGIIWENNIPIAEVGNSTLLGQVDLLSTKSEIVTDRSKDIQLPPFKHLLTRIKVNGGGQIRPVEEAKDKSRVALATGVSLYSGKVTSVMEAGEMVQPTIKDNTDYFAIISYGSESTTSSTNLTKLIDGKYDYINDKNVRIIVKPEGKPESIFTLERPTATIDGISTRTLYAGSSYIIGNNNENGSITPDDMLQ